MVLLLAHAAAAALWLLAGPWPLTAEPDITVHKLDKHDEFMIMGSDGFWDCQGPMHSQRPIDAARSWLQQHNNPQECARQFMADTLTRTRDNVTIAVVCFGRDPPNGVDESNIAVQHATTTGDVTGGL